MKCAVFGLGKLGLPLAVVLASKGHIVVGVDTSKQMVDEVNSRTVSTFEPQVMPLLNHYGRLVRATTDVNEAVNNTDLAFIVVPTPSEADGSFSTTYVLQAIELIGSALRDREEPYSLVLVSTVMPGTMDNVLVPALEEASGKKHEKDFRICYSPEFIALGSVVRDILQPDFVLIGESCSRTGEFLAKIYRDIVGPHVPIERMNFVSAEITKLALNCYVTLKISYANMLGQVCDSIPGADAPKVCKALGNDGRIGSRYLVPATAYGGPCFPRDNRAFSNVVGPLEVMPQVIDAINRRQTVRIGSIVLKALSFGERVAVLGLAYKPGTPVVEESAGVAIAEFLADRMLTQPIVWDPLALDHAQQVLGDKVEYGESLATTLRVADVVVVTLPCSEFVEMPPPELVKTTVIDLWGIVDRANLPPDARYLRPGIGT
jgi:UDPglucose 6-dehydrogenase